MKEYLLSFIDLKMQLLWSWYIKYYSFLEIILSAFIILLEKEYLKMRDRVMGKDDVISVIVPVYNVETYIERCLKSILMQTYKNMQVILVDDGSTDSSGVLCDKYAKKDARITVIHKKNGGISSARNAGLNVASGKYIGFVDSDDWIEPDMYQSMVRCMKQTGVKIVRCGVVRNKEYKLNDSALKYQDKVSYNIFGLVESASSVWKNGYMCNKLFAAELFQTEPKVRFNVDIKYVEDQPVLLDCLIRCGGMADIAEGKYHYFINPSSITGTEFNLNKISVIIGFKHMCKVCDEHIPELSDLFKSKYYSVCIGFLLQHKVRKSKIHKEALSAEVRKNLKEVLKLKNMSVKFKIVAIMLSII